MKEQNNKFIEIIIEQAVQLEIARLKNYELSCLVEKLAEQLVQYDPAFSSLPKILRKRQC